MRDIIRLRRINRLDMKQVNQTDIPEYSNILLFLFLGIRSTVLNAPLIVVPMNKY